MAHPQTFSFTTGATSLPDVGMLRYNGCTFGPLFETKISGKAVKDNAQRTTKYMEYKLRADGYVTLAENANANASINPEMTNLRRLLTAQGGDLRYEGRGFDIDVNNKTISDVAWGPVPELIEFQPLGAGRSAKVQWEVTVRIPELPRLARKTIRERDNPAILQLNYETTVSYGDDQFSTLSINGTIEIDITRITQPNRRMRRTVDDVREVLEENILRGIDHDRFRITSREFNISRDKRTLEFSVKAEELPYMLMPEHCTLANGTYNVRPLKAGGGLASWLCTLKASYTMRMPGPRFDTTGARRNAWTAFLALLRLRMNKSSDGVIPKQKEPEKKERVPFWEFNPFREGRAQARRIGGNNEVVQRLNPASDRVWLMDFSVDEGLYLDSKRITFSATWRLVTDFSHILLASGLWRKVEERDFNRNSLWAISMRDITGTSSWITNRLDPTLDVIVDFGGPKF